MTTPDEISDDQLDQMEAELGFIGAIARLCAALRAERAKVAEANKLVAVCQACVTDSENRAKAIEQQLVAEMAKVAENEEYIKDLIASREVAASALNEKAARIVTLEQQLAECDKVNPGVLKAVERRLKDHR